MTNIDIEKKDRIMEAARSLIFHYGFKKTTMQDIAREADMSVGALYNVFKNKEEIAISCAEAFKFSVVVSMRAISEGNMKPERKLLEMMLCRGLSCHEHFKDTPHGVEIVTALAHRSEEMRSKFEKMDVDLVTDVINEGNSTGVFSVKRPKDYARTFVAAFSRFCPPMSLAFSEAETKRETKKMVEMLLPALRKS